MSNIKAESCYLHWDAPLDNGGSELTNYTVEKMEVMKDEPELEEGQEAPPEPQWVEVTNTIIDKKYGVRPPALAVKKPNWSLELTLRSDGKFTSCPCSFGTLRPTRPTCSESELRTATANLTHALLRKSKSWTRWDSPDHRRSRLLQSTPRLP